MFKTGGEACREETHSIHGADQSGQGLLVHNTCPLGPNGERESRATSPEVLANLQRAARRRVRVGPLDRPGEVPNGGAALDGVAWGPRGDDQ